MLGAPCDLSGHPYDLPDQEDIMLLDCSPSPGSSSFEAVQHTDEFDVPYPSPFFLSLSLSLSLS